MALFMHIQKDDTHLSTYNLIVKRSSVRGNVSFLPNLP